ncbi:MAG TPA: hypothetical protein VIJ62_10100 [Rhizomicrobium sp.]
MAYRIDDSCHFFNRGVPMPNQQDRVNPRVVLVVCLAVVAIMFLGSILIGYATIQSERASPTQQTEP